MVTMLVVILIGNWETDLSCWTCCMRTLTSDWGHACRQLVPAILSETARLGSCRDKWLIHFRLHVWLARLSLDMNGSEKPLEISDSTKMEALL
jgi:hypothetical protein